MKPFLYKRRFLFIPFVVAAFLGVISFIVMTLWNSLLPGILHVTAITYWQAMGIFVLCKILFGFGKGGPGRWGGGSGAPWMRHRMEERFKNMSPEEREKFRARMEMCGRGKWGRHGRPDFEKYWESVKPEEGKES